MKKLVILCLIGAIMFGPVQAFAEEQAVQRLTYLSDKEPVFSVDFSELWEVRLKGGKITGISEDGLVWFTAGQLKGYTDLKGAAEYANNKIKERLSDIKKNDPRSSTVNDMPALILEGTAKEEGKDVIYLVVLVKTSAGKIGGIAFVGDPIVKELHSQDVADMANSLLSA